MTDETEQDWKTWKYWGDVPLEVQAQLAQGPFPTQGPNLGSGDLFYDALRKIIACLCLLICFSLPAHSTTTVSGSLKNLGGGSVTLGTFIRFYLRGCSGNQPRVNGTAIIAPTLGNVYYFDFVPNPSGVISGTVYSTTDATGTGNGDLECGGLKTGLWYGMVAFLNGKAGPETPIAAKNLSSIDISNITPLTANPVVASPTGDGTYSRLDGGNMPFTGTIQGAAATLSGAVTTQSLNGELQVGNGTGQYTSIALCYAALSAGQGCAIPNNWSDPNWTANLVISKNHTYLRFMGDATMNMQTFSVTMASSVAGFKIITPGNQEATSAGIRWLYTGTGSAFTIGDGTASTSGIDWGGMVINTVSAGSAATCLTLNQVVFGFFKGVQCFGANSGTQVGFLLSDGGGTVGTIDNTFINTRITNVQKAIRFVPTSTGGASNNTFQTVNIGTSVASNIGFDFQAASTGNDIMNADLNGLATAINFAAAGTVNNNRFHAAFLQNNTTDVNAGAGSHDNFVDPVGNVTVTVTDSGTNNSFLGLTTQLKVGSGSATKPAVNIGGTAGFFNNAGNTNWTTGTTSTISLGAASGGSLGLRSNQGIEWPTTGGAPDAAQATGLGRAADGVVTADTTAIGNALGEMRSAKISATYNAAGTVQTAVHLVVDTCTLGSTCGITLSGSAAYTSATSYTCTCHDQTTPLNACGVNQTGGGALTITGTGTDVIRYLCVGN